MVRTNIRYRQNEIDRDGRQGLRSRGGAHGFGPWVLFLAALLFALSGCGLQDAAYVADLGESKAEVKPTDESAAGTKPSDESAESREPRQIYVYVCGAVVSPGVVTLPLDSRAQDALSAAGGFAEDAQEDYVNLAAPVKDGEKLYFPSVEEALELTAQEAGAAAGLVNINTADVAALCSLPGIGESRAQAIVDYREQNGDFQTTEDIMKVAGIKEGAYRKLCDRITIN